MTFKLIIGLLLFLGVASGLPAQPVQTPLEEPIEFRAIGWNREIPEMFYELKGQAQPLPLYRRSPSLPQRYIGPAKIVFYVPAVIDGQPTKTPLAEVTLKQPPHKNLVVIWLEKSGRYNATVLADEPDSPPPGHLRFINISGQELALKCNGREQFLLSAGKEQTVSPHKGGVGVGVKMARQIKGTQSWELVMMKGLPVKPTERVTAFIADPSRIALSPEDEAMGPGFQPDALTLFLIRDRVVQQ